MTGDELGNGRFSAHDFRAGRITILRDVRSELSTLRDLGQMATVDDVLTFMGGVIEQMERTHRHLTSEEAKRAAERRP